MKGSPHPGLCGECRWARTTGNRRGSVFWLCERSKVEPGFPRYPRIPVLRCAGFEAVDDDDPEGVPGPAEAAKRPDAGGDVDAGGERPA